MIRSVATLLAALVLSSACLAEPIPNQGFIHGTLTLTDATTHTGFLRWENEEAFWNDLFHSRQVEIPWTQYADMKALQDEKRQQYYKTHGLLDRVAYAMENDDDDTDISRLFIMRFGDINVISIDANENVTVELNDGSTHKVRGYSNDVSSDIIVYPGAGEPETLEWDDLAEIHFTAAPADTVPYAERLYGRVTSTRGKFEGFIQWDESECTTIDILDSRQEDVPMGDIAAIRRDPGAGSEVTLKDGKVLILSGSNDVGKGHRGVIVETADQGRINIPWKRFQQVDFVTGKGSGQGRDTFADNRNLTGEVTTTDGEVWQGRIVYDMDEVRSHDIFNGTYQDLKYDIPFGLIAAIKPRGPNEALITLRSGQLLELSDNQDTGRDHAGVLVFGPDDQVVGFVTWNRLQEVHFSQ